MSENQKLFTRAELKSHNTRDDAYIIIDNIIYDVSKFLEEHPGGEEVLMELAGEDATEAFEDVSHSSDARSLMKKYKVGEVVEADRMISKTNLKPEWTADQAIEISNWSSWMVPLVLAVAATVIFRFLFL